MINEDKLLLVLRDLNDLVTKLVLRNAKRDWDSKKVVREIRELDEQRKRLIEEVFGNKAE